MTTHSLKDKSYLEKWVVVLDVFRSSNTMMYVQKESGFLYFQF